MGMAANKFIFLIIAGMTISIRLFSQQSFGGFPFAFQNNINTAITSVYSLPLVNNEIEKSKADSITKATCTTCDNNYYGKGLNTSIDLKNAGQLQIQDDGSKVWLLKIESHTAYGMQFYFDKFKIPEMATLFIYNQDSSMILGAFTSENNPADESKTIKFGTQIIRGNSIIIEYWEPNNADFEGELRIANVIHVFEQIGTTGGPFGAALPCQRNVNCESTVWFPERNSVVMILYYDENNDYTAWCTGSIINNTSEDGRVLLLTAFHTINGTGTEYNYSNWTFLFNHQGNCSSDGSDVPGYTGQSIFGSTLLTADEDYNTSDYLLLDLNASKANMISYGACYAGWDRSENLPGSSSTPVVMIHHPNGDIKKISKSVNKPVPAPCEDGDYWLINWRGAPDYPDWGPAEKGSSGAPIFNSEHRIVGQNFGGNFCDNVVDVRDCENPQYSNAGKFYKSWNHSGATGFAFYLDPNSTGQTSTNTYCPTNSTDPTNPGSGTGVLCYDPISKGMIINESTPGNIPCVDLPIVLKPIDCYWKVPLTHKDYDCDDKPSPAYCYVRIVPPWNCRCTYLQYFIEIAEVDNTYNQVGNAYSKWFFEDHGDGSTGDYASIPKITVNQDMFYELGIIPQPGKLYRIKLAANQGGWQEAVRYFRINPNDIYFVNVNLMNNYDFFDNLPQTFFDHNVPASDVLGRNVILENVTTTNNYNPNSIYIKATNNISITNSVITPGFSASIVSDACAGYSGRMANPGGKNSQSENNYPEKIVYYSFNPAENDEHAKINKPNQEKFEKTTESKVWLYPNPSNNGKFFFSSYPESEFKRCDIVIYSLLGEKIFETRISDPLFVIDISNQPKGVYFAELRMGNEFSIQKIVYQ